MADAYGKIRRWEIEDPYLKGQYSYRGLEHCQVCNRKVFGIIIHGVTLPEGIDVAKTILRSTNTQPHKRFVGINCGCYAKFHRQVAHIQDRMKASPPTTEKDIVVI